MNSRPMLGHCRCQKRVKGSARYCRKMHQTPTALNVDHLRDGHHADASENRLVNNCDPRASHIL